MINARLSDRTFKRLSGSPFARKLLLPKGLEILTTSERQRARWLEIGVDEKHIQIVGNLKVDAVDSTVEQDKKPEELKASLGFEKDSLVLAGISTWPGGRTAHRSLEPNQKAQHRRPPPSHSQACRRRRSIVSMLRQTKFPYHVARQSIKLPRILWFILQTPLGNFLN